MDFHLQDFNLILTVVVVSVGIIGQRAQACDPNDLRSLQRFMAALQNPPDGWKIANSSDSRNCCELWEGVSCDEEGRVVKLELPGKRLSGKLSDSLGSLDQLRTLNLSNNFLRSSLPESLFNLSKLQVLDLSYNEFYGSVHDFANLSSIQLIRLSHNHLNGSLPSRVCNVGSTELKVLKLAENHFSGEVPSGFGDCTSLENLNLRMNDIGGISEGLFRLQKLSVLILSDNRLSGPLSQAIGNLTSLTYLDISHNGLSGTIPNIFHKFGKLKHFVAQSNSFVGNIPDTLSNSPTINDLNLRNNSLEGIINLNCYAMVSLTSLDLANNRFTGHIPNNLPDCQNLNSVFLFRNNFTGEIPKSFKDFQSLYHLSLSNTKTTNLSSALRILHHCKNLTVLVLNTNFLGEVFPKDPDLHFPRLKILIIANSRLAGPVPEWLSKSERLQLLDLSWNRLVGTVPGWFGDFQSLFFLDISNNSFTGKIPRNLLRLPSFISKDIPIEEPLNGFQFVLKRNMSALGLQYNDLWTFPPTLDLSHNNLSGPVWPEFGNLRKLHFLDLQFNNLSGSIPSSLSGMSSLETLDLSHNGLSGTIPFSLVRLNFLSKFSVAFNKLHGVIPSGGQFQTFPNSSFEGNDFCCDASDLHTLCSRICDDDQFQPDETNSESATRDRDCVLLITIGVGVVFGFVFGATLFEAVSRRSPLVMKLLLRLNIHT